MQARTFTLASVQDFRSLRLWALDQLMQALLKALESPTADHRRQMGQAADCYRALTGSDPVSMTSSMDFVGMRGTLNRRLRGEWLELLQTAKNADGKLGEDSQYYDRILALSPLRSLELLHERVGGGPFHGTRVKEFVASVQQRHSVRPSFVHEIGRDVWVGVRPKASKARAPRTKISGKAA
jgi:hypothetical protein